MNLDPAAVRTANARLFAEHPELGGRPLTLGPKDAALRRKWRKLYAEEAARRKKPTPPAAKTLKKHEASRAVSAREFPTCKDTAVGVMDCSRDPCKGAAPPAMPPSPPPDPGAGPFASSAPLPDDRAKRKTYLDYAGYMRKIGFTNAARHMEHFLSATGTTLIVSVDDMLKDIDSFRKSVTESFENMKKRIAREMIGVTSCKPIESRFGVGEEADAWAGHYARGKFTDWFYAVGGFQYSITGTASVIPCSKPPTLRLQYRVHVFDRYNWDSGKSTKIFGLIATPDAELGRLHEAGVAQEFDIKGSSSVTTAVFPLASR